MWSGILRCAALQFLPSVQSFKAASTPGCCQSVSLRHSDSAVEEVSWVLLLLVQVCLCLHITCSPPYDSSLSVNVVLMPILVTKHAL